MPEIEKRKCSNCSKEFRGYKQNGIWVSARCPTCRKDLELKKKAKKKLSKKSVEKEIRTLERKAWTKFAKFVRERNMTFQGYVECYTCSRNKPIELIDAGHFKHRGNARFKAIDFEEKHIHAQCKSCNAFRGGMEYEFSQHLKEDYGEAWVAEIVRRRQTDLPLTKDELLEIINKYAKV